MFAWLIKYKAAAGYWDLVWLIPLLVCSALLWNALDGDYRVVAPIIDLSIPDFELQNLDGSGVLQRSDLPESRFLLNVWGSWCVSCIAEHPFLTALQKNNGISIVGLNYHDETELAQAFLMKYGNPYVFHISDPQGRLAIELGVIGAPETMVVENNKVLFKHIGVLNDRIWQAHFIDYFKPVIELKH